MFRELGYRSSHVKPCRCNKSETSCLIARTMSLNIKYEVLRDGKYLLTPWSRVLLEQLTGLQLVKNFPHFMEPEGSSPYSECKLIQSY